MNNIQIFLKQNYEIFKRDFWILIGLNIGVSVIINFTFVIHEVLIFLLCAVVFIKNLSFIRSASIMPSVSSDFDRFSWKYYMGLPLNKKEIIIALILSNLMVMIPLLVAVLCFYPQLLWMLEGEKVNKFAVTSWYFKGFLLGIAFFAFTSIGSITQQILTPRRKYSKISPKILYLQTLRTALVTIAAMGYSAAGLFVLNEIFPMNYDFLFKGIGIVLNYILTTWLLILVAFWFVFQSYKGTLIQWQDEKAGYVKNTWQPKRDYSLITLSIFLISGPFIIFDFDFPTRYEGSALNKAIYEDDLTEVKRLITKTKDLNTPNAYGYTPAMVAIAEGNFKALMELEKAGAKYEGQVVMKKTLLDGKNPLHLAIQGKDSNVFYQVLNKNKALLHSKDTNGDLPIHTAARLCHTEFLDAMITEYKDINVQNIHGNTPLHLAVIKKCFTSVDLLLSMNSDRTVKNLKKMVAADYLKDWSTTDRNELYMVGKKLRAPASIKK